VPWSGPEVRNGQGGKLLDSGNSFILELDGAKNPELGERQLGNGLSWAGGRRKKGRCLSRSCLRRDQKEDAKVLSGLSR